jgi:tRNA threonylcarbamoyladenosine biosynthesis protein TsaB
MIVLAIETATAQVGCALLVDDQVVATHEVNRGRRHVENLVPAIQFLCRQAGVELRELSAIAVDVGPGLFTGMRVGITTAKTLGQSLAVPLVPVCSLDVIAHRLRGADRTIAAVIDARRGEVFYALFSPEGGGCRRVTEPQVCTPDDLIADLLGSDIDIQLVGDGAHTYADRLASDVPRSLPADRVYDYPAAAALALVAAPLVRSGAGRAASLIEPLYLRRPDAEINWSVREGARR